MSKEPSKRQLEALWAIYVFTKSKGFPPTIRDLKKPLGVKSDQGVIELLDRLQSAGYITRDPSTARSTFLTREAYLYLEAQPIPDKETGGNDNSTPFEFERSEQKELYDWLMDTNPALSGAYQGALRVIRDKGNQDRIRQSASSLRAIMAYFADNSGFPGIKEKGKRNPPHYNVIRTAHYFGLNLTNSAQGLTVYHRWHSEFQDRFHGLSHGTGEKIELDNFVLLISTFENFLTQYIIPQQIDIYDILDGIIKAGPEIASAEQIRSYATRNTEAFRYFLNKVDEKWFDFLLTNKFLLPAHYVGYYLGRMAGIIPLKVRDLVVNTAAMQNDPNIKSEYTEAITKLPPDSITSILKKINIRDWISDDNGNLHVFHLIEILKILVNAAKYEAARNLALELLNAGTEKDGIKFYFYEYRYEDILTNLVELPPNEIRPCIDFLLKRLLDQRDALEFIGFSYPPIGESHPRNHTTEQILISHLTILFKKYFDHLNTTSAIKAAEELFSDASIRILMRFKLYVYRMNPDKFKELVPNVIIDFFDNVRVRKEYVALLKEAYPRLPVTTKKEFLDLVDKGPIDQELESDQLETWKKMQLVWIEKYLTEEERGKYKKILRDAKESDDTGVNDGIISEWVGPESPASQDDLEKLPLEKILEYLIEWRPSSEEIFGPSRSGLGLSFRSLVAKKARDYSSEAEKLLNNELRPVYVYHFISGIDEAIRSETEVDWDALINLFGSIVHAAKSNTLPTFPKGPREERESGWDSVFQEIARVLNHGLNKKDLISKGKKRVVFEIISFLCTHNDPTPEYERKNGEHDLDYYTLSVNTVRGHAFHALIAYMFWCNRGKSEKKAIPKEVREILKVEIEDRQSLTTRSVIGRYLPWLMIYDEEFTKKLLPELFPDHNTDLRYAAWETYLTNFFIELYPLFYSEYIKAIDDIASGQVPKRRYWSDPTEKLAQHVMIGYLRDLDSTEKPIYKYFFSILEQKYRAFAVEYAGKHYLVNQTPPEETPVDISRLRGFWEWRLNESSDPKELAEFGWWADKTKFEAEWMLKQLQLTVEKTKGELEGVHVVVKTLDELAADYPAQCVEILNRMIRFTDTRYQMLYVYVERIENILKTAYASKNVSAIKQAEKAIDYLVRLGFEQMRQIARQYKNSDDAATN